MPRVRPETFDRAASDLAAYRAALQAAAARETLFRVALTKIADRVSMSARTKAELQNALDAVGVLAADALAAQHDVGEP